MNFDFIFWLFFVGIVIATIQDLKRREVDNWLNLLLIFSSVSFVVFGSIFSGEYYKIFQLMFMIGVMFVMVNICYYGRIFAGGDAKLLFAMTALFLGNTLFESLTNLGIFLFFLMLAGSIYGLIYSSVIYFRDFKKINKKIKKGVLKGIKYSLFFGSVFLILGFYNDYFFLFSAIFFFLPLVYSFAKGLEEVSMTRFVSGKKLREGDWLAEDVKVRRRVINAGWDGLSKEDILLMKNLKRVRIKEGIPFVPAFFIAFVAYSLFKNFFLNLF